MIDTIKNLTFVHALVAAVVLVALAMTLFKTGLVNSLLWLAALVALIIGAVNYFSYRSG